MNITEESDEEVVEFGQRRCVEELAWAMQECEAVGHHLVQSVILRNSDIFERCNNPDLFDRFGKLNSEYCDKQESEVEMLQRMSI